MRFAFLREERHRVVAIHGILTGLTSPSWATDFAPWAESRHPLVRAQARISHPLSSRDAARTRPGPERSRGAPQQIAAERG
jgi:hypothetical protein